jgi:hypothetical protein
VLANLELFETLPGDGLIADFRAVIKASNNVADLSKALFESIPRQAPKAEFALDLLATDTDKFNVPQYIDEGLIWLAAEIQKRCKDFGLPIVAVEAGGRPA